MRLRSVTVEDIRSYARATVTLDAGITLLAGDIGSGKSSILHAIEFALFGMQRGEGESLLRHGAQQGSVTLAFDVDGKACVVHRALKRTKTGVAQDAGWLEVEGRREALSPVELKARVFGLIGYPLAYLARKHTLYRHTVYTPQEQMKQILAASPEERLETVRRVFGVDIYKLIGENAQQLGRELRALLEGETQVLERMRHELAALEDALAREPERVAQRAQRMEERTRLAVAVEQAERARERAERTRSAAEQERQALAMRVRERELLARERAQLVQQRAEKEARLTTLRMQLAAPPEPSVDITALERSLKTAQEELRALRERKGKALALIEEHGPELHAGDTCPVCRQEVGEEHLASLRETLTAKRAAAQKRLAKAEEEILARQRDADALERALADARGSEERRRRRILLEENVAGLDADIARLAPMIAERESALAGLPATDPAPLDAALQAATAALTETKRVLADVRTTALATERGIAALDQELAQLREQRARRDTLAAEREQLGAQRDRRSALRGWLADRFLPFLSVVEREMLLAIHTTFDAAFRDWFAKLVEDDGLRVRLDEAFTPVIQQQGYETDASSLSGGERTALALAYRLALVQAIHALLPHLGTAGLLILDEPTDGFSREQLVRMRDVLRELDVEQVILVSHEPQLATFVDHVLRVEKGTDGSRVASESL